MSRKPFEGQYGATLVVHTLREAPPRAADFLRNSTWDEGMVLFDPPTFSLRAGVTKG